MAQWLPYLVALLGTIVMETLLACLLRPREARRLVSDVPLMNLASHPLLHVAVRAGLPLPMGELLVTIGEAIVYRTITRLSMTWSLALSAACNAASWLVGPSLLGWF